MTLALIAAALPANAAPMPEVTSFISACLDGRIAAKTGQIEAVSLRDLPHQLKEYLKGWDRGLFYKVRGDSEGYLLTIQGKPSQLTGLNEICAFAAKRMHFPAAHDQVMAATLGSSARIERRAVNTPPYLQYYQPQERYVLTASLLSPHYEPKSDYNYSILLLGRFNEADRQTTEAFLKDLQKNTMRTKYRTLKPWLGQQPPGLTDVPVVNDGKAR